MNYEIKIPKEPFSGVKLGALRFIKQLEDESLTSNQFTSTYAYTISVMLTEDKQPFDEGAELQLKSWYNDQCWPTCGSSNIPKSATKSYERSNNYQLVNQKGQTKELLKKYKQM